jgi:hypothetical protein
MLKNDHFVKTGSGGTNIGKAEGKAAVSFIFFLLFSFLVLQLPDVRGHERTHSACAWHDATGT